MSSAPLLVGITGGIGSGKTTVCQVFKALGAPVYDADTAAKRLMNEDPELRLHLQTEFGEETYQNEKLNRSYLSQLVFNDPVKLARLNAITHPAVGKDFEKWVSQHFASPYLVKEAALLIESGMNKHLDLMLLVTAPESVRLTRVLQRDKQKTEQEIRLIMHKQMPEEEKRKFCRLVIENDSSNPILSELLRLHSIFEQKALHLL